MVVGGGRGWLWEEEEDGCGRRERMVNWLWEEVENSYGRRERIVMGGRRE